MKTRVFIVLIALLAFFSSCIKAVKEDPADRFVGTYSFTDSYFTTWGSASASFNDSGTFMITKLGPSEVQISKPWGTTAAVLGNQLNINPASTSKVLTTPFREPFGLRTREKCWPICANALKSKLRRAVAHYE